MNPTTPHPATPARVYDPLYVSAYAWLGVPLMMFTAFWLRPWIAVTLTVIVGAAIWWACRGTTPYPSALFKHRKRRLAVMAVIATVWILLAGIGGYLFQDLFDHPYRNAVYRDLITHSWPAVEWSEGTLQTLCYYFGFWLIPSGLAKITGSVELGYAFQVVYALIGVMITVMLIFRWLGSVRWIAFVLFLLCGGWEWLGDPMSHTDSLRDFMVQMSDHTFEPFAAFPLTNQIFYVYYQAIPTWIVTMLILKQRQEPRLLMLTFALLMLYSPFSAMGLIPLMAWLLLRRWRESLSWVNAVGLIVCLVISCFYLSNSCSGNGQLLPATPYHVWRYTIYMIASYLVYMPFVWRDIKCDATFWWLFVPVVGLVWVRFGSYYDLAYRSTVPSSLYLLLMLMRKACAITSWRGWRQRIFACALALGMVSSVSLIVVRCVERYKTPVETMGNRHEFIESTFTVQTLRFNFIAEGESFFTRHMMRRSDDTPAHNPDE